MESNKLLMSAIDKVLADYNSNVSEKEPLLPNVELLSNEELASLQALREQLQSSSKEISKSTYLTAFDAIADFFEKRGDGLIALTKFVKTLLELFT